MRTKFESSVNLTSFDEECWKATLLYELLIQGTNSQEIMVCCTSRHNCTCFSNSSLFAFLFANRSSDKIFSSVHNLLALMKSVAAYALIANLSHACVLTKGVPTRVHVRHNTCMHEFQKKERQHSVTSSKTKENMQDLARQPVR